MDNSLASVDWSLLQSFLAVAESGSLSGAAESLGHSQPTIGRHIRNLEEALNVELFQRHPRGLRLTASGARIRPAAEEMRSAMNQIALLAEAEAGEPHGTVRIAASVFAAHHVLPPMLARIRAVASAISLVLHPSDDSDNLTFREADIAVRMYRPSQLDLVTRHIGDIEMGVFAAHGYLDRQGSPESASDLKSHDIIGYDQSPLIIDGMAAMGMPYTMDDFPLRTDNQTAYWELVRSGGGIGFTQAHVGRADPFVEELDLGIEIPSLPIWLTAHETVRRIPRVDRIWTLLSEELETWLREI